MLTVLPMRRGARGSAPLASATNRSSSAFGNVFLGRDLDFAVTPKTKQAPTGPAWHLIRPQLIAMSALAGALVIGAIRILVGQANTFGAIFNMIWVVYDLVIFSVIIQAARYRGFEPEDDPQPLPEPVHARPGAH